ncbi:hypothetical protein I4641_09425 [Waterburya agarophytonicola K14]|uniref:Virulence-associated protein E-like domain-containing protein n=1 Tax=Waterburya agarophytonicola KI4 TaxID=2874699 RepID=A0A964BS22_9CYAN|nr:virulence-associated E family protein [Waterburya agarophytonicola]MCC0177196.1 hypothetical protein [Waterburya agarophytonicola KI4]
MINTTTIVAQEKENINTTGSVERTNNNATDSVVRFKPATKPPLGTYTPDVKDLEQECLKFLDLIGYSTGEDLEPDEDARFVEFFARAIYNNTGGEGAINEKTGKKYTALNLNNNLGSMGFPLLRELHKYQLLGYDIFFVVNGQGNKAREINFGKCFYFEIDKDENGETIPLDKQYSYALKSMGGREPSVTLHTGGKSLHFYYRLDRPLPKKDWKPLQRDLIDHIGYSDDAIKDICRVMRLPGFHYKGTENISSIYQYSDKSYSYEELREFIPQSKSKKTTSSKSRTRSSSTSSSSSRTNKRKGKPQFQINNGDIEEFAKKALKGTYYEMWQGRRSVKDGEQNTSLYQLVCEIVGNVQATAYSEEDGYALALEYMNSFENFNPNDPWTEEHLKDMWERESSQNKEGFYTSDKDSGDNYPGDADIQKFFHEQGSGGQNLIMKNLLGMNSNEIFSLDEPELNKLILENDLEPIRHNILTGCNEILGEPLEIPVALKLFEDKTDLFISQNKFARFVAGEAHENRYNPVEEKLFHCVLSFLGEEKLGDMDFMSSFPTRFREKLSKYYNRVVQNYIGSNKNTFLVNTDARLFDTGITKDKPDSISLGEIFKPLPTLTSLEEFLKNVFNSTDNWDIDFAKKFLISAVARTLDPGCKSDDVFIIRSNKQGLLKSTFFKTLAFDDFYTVKTGNDVVSKDAIEGLYRGWIHEIDEIERVTRTREAHDTKSFISKTHDNYRAPYEKQSINRPRHWVLVGTSNDDVLFIDSENRRYNVVTIDKTIDIEYVKKYRETVWAMATLAYLQGEKWYYSESEEGARVRKERNEQYKVVDDNLATYAEMLSSTRAISTTEFIDLIACQRPFDKMNQVKVGKFFKELGWDKKRITKNGVRTWVYVKPEANIT